MTRTSLITLAAAIAAFALIGCAVPETSTPPPPSPACSPAVQARVRAALPVATRVTCPGADGAQARPPGTAGAAAGAPGEAGEKVEARAALPGGRIATVELSSDGKTVLGIRYAHADLVDSSGKGMAIVFWLFALISVGGALFVVSRRNLIAAVMGMVGSFLGIAAVYMMLYAQFLAIVQMLVYAGAIMVLFVFVIMILNRPEDEPVAPAGRAGQVLGGLAILYLVIRLIAMLTHVEPPSAELANAAPLPTAQGYDWGSVAAVGTDLFNGGLFPFEAISILLLVAVVGAIAIARPLHPGADNAGDDDEDAIDPATTVGRDPASHSPGGAA